MSYCIYQFEAVFIQDYILADGKMKTMVGASELLEAITNELLDQVINELGLQAYELTDNDKQELKLTDTQVVFPRRAGSVFQMVLQNSEKAQAFATLWPVLVSNFAPGLRFSAALEEGTDFQATSKSVRDELTRQKNQPQSLLPESTPLTVRFQRTGKAQISSPNNAKNGLDWTMQAKANAKFDLLERKFLFKDPASATPKHERPYTFPKQFEHTSTDKAYWQEAFPFKSTDAGNHTVAIIHADGNGLGKYLHGIFHKLSTLGSAEAIRAYREFSIGLDKATQQAAHNATVWLSRQYDQCDNPFKTKAREKSPNQLPLPMRPIILGGDDLTCIIRADYAIGFLQEFTKAFEHKTKEFIAKLQEDKTFQGAFSELPDSLSCTSGMLFLRSNQPFNLGYALAEELCSEAKKEGQNEKNTPSLVNFLRTTNTLFDDYDTQIEQELKTSNGQFLSAMPYAFQEGSDRPTLAELFALRAYFDEGDDTKLNPSAIRRYATHLYSNPAYAQTFWNRWEKQCLENPSIKPVWLEFSQAFNRIAENRGVPISELVSLFALEITELGESA